jgi:hypothetical protein
VMQQPVVLSPKFWANFNAVAVKSDIRMRNWLFVLPRWILCEQLLNVKENDEHALNFALHLSHFFRSRRVSTLRVRFMLYFRMLV